MIKLKCVIDSLLVLCFLLNPINSVAQPAKNYKQTVWRNVDSSLSELLNSGWQLSGQSSSRTSTPPVLGSPTPRINEVMHTFTLAKSGKYIICILLEPRVQEETYSACRSFN
jgi:hypothetical protein